MVWLFIGTTVVLYTVITKHVMNNVMCPCTTPEFTNSEILIESNGN